ncbi:MAG: S8 family serine peptidase, partial [Pontiellaceae bacterium]|nr:S8 family serine peptidase [Pontiellaceae bacterium]
MKRRIAVVVLSGVLFPFAGQAAPSAVADKSGLLPAVVPAQSAHKVQVSDPVTAQQIVAKGGRLLADYGSYQLYAVESIGPELADAASVEIRDDYDRIELNAGMIITTEPAVQALRKPVGAFKGKHTHLVQFIGPVQPAWYAALEETGVRIVCYIPQNAYLIFGDADSLACVQKLAATTGFLQWENTYSAANKVHPGARLADINGKARVIGTDLFEIQLVADDEMNPETLKLIDTLKLAPIRRQSKQLGYVNIVVRVDPASLDQIAGQPDVVSIQPYFEPEKFCERQDQIVAGNLSGNSPAGPGYLAWLLSKGFTQAQFDSSNFAVDVTDSGVDNGTTSPNHFGLYFNGTRPGTSHMIYNRLEGTANSGSTIQGLDGHGNLNAHIIAGFNDLTGFPHTDAGGYRYGLGICPFVRVGSSVIFDPNYYTYPDFEDLQSRAYRDGARISNNSWGANTGGAYNSDSQRYDYLVRDAQPAGAAVTNAGNQEMVIVFAAGNAGSGVNTVGTPGTGKNLFTIAASENVHPFGGADGSGISDSGADSVNDIIYFSSRGPCDDGRIKPDIAAPGTHVSGGVAQSDTPGPSGTAIAGFTGGGVSGGPFGSLFWPTNQQFFSASSGTSHSAPGVAGGCALTRQYFINQGWNTPSPAMTKAYLMNSTRHLTGTYANDTLPSNNQGMGLMDLDFAFNGVLRILRDQLTNELFTATGQTCVFEGRVADTGKPFRITLAWTDAPGNTSGNAYNNDLNLTVNIAGNTYKGNVFSGASSVSGGTGDAKNNVESVFLPAGVSGAFTVTVTAANINSDGVPNYGTSLDQDFALVIYNARPEALTVTPAAGLNASGYQGGPFTSTNIVYTLNNTSTSNLSWTAGCASNWVTVSPAGGTLSAGQTNLVTVSINANANSLGAGTNTGLIVFSNVTSSISLVRNVQLVVRPRVLDHFTWDPVSTTQYVGQAFPVRIQALDATDSLLASFT